MMMNIEELKLILETVNGVTGEAKEIAVLYLAATSVLPAILWMIVGCGLYALAQKIITGFSREEQFCRWRDALRIGSPGSLSAGEERLLVVVIDALIANKAAPTAQEPK